MPESPRAGEDGWRLADPPDVAGFDRTISPLLARLLPDAAEAWFEPRAAHFNTLGTIHGGFLAAFAEVTLILPLHLAGTVARNGGVTVDFTLQYLSPGIAGLPLLARIELLRETKRLAFVRGTITQRGAVITAYSATLRKLLSR